MAQRSTVRFDPDRGQGTDLNSEFHWTELRAVNTRRAAPPKRHSAQLLLLLGLVAILGMSAMAIYFTFFQPTVERARTEVPGVESKPNLTTKVIVRGNSRYAKASGFVHGSQVRPGYASSAATGVFATRKAVWPPAYIDVLTSDGRLRMQLTNGGYHLDIASGVFRRTADVRTADVISSPRLSDTAAHDLSVPQRTQANDGRRTVTLEVVINRDGTVRDTHVIAGSPALAAAAVDAVQRWKFAVPPLANGQVTEYRSTVTISFDVSQ